MKRLLKWGIVILIIACSLLWGSRRLGTENKRPGGEMLVVGSKNFTENALLAHMIAELIEHHTNLKVERKINLGSSSLAWQALLNDEIQIYPEYTGTIVLDFYHEQADSADEALQKAQALLKPENLAFTNRFGFSNTYALAAKQELVKKYDLNSLSGLATHAPHLRLGCDFEFMERADGYPALKREYQMHFKNVKMMNRGIAYRCIRDNRIDVVMTYSTDGQLLANHLVPLKDDRSFFPPYEAGILIRLSRLEANPELKSTLSLLEGQISEEEMREMNLQVDQQGRKAQCVAREFLAQKGLLNAAAHKIGEKK